MGSLLRLLRIGDRGTELAERAGSLDGQANARLKFSPIATAAS